MEKKGEKIRRELAFLVLALIIVGSGYFLLYEEGITGAVVGAVEEGKLEQVVWEELEGKQNVSVIIELKGDAKTVSPDLEERKEAIKEKQEEVLEELNLEEKKRFLGLLREEKEFELENQYSTVNALSGEVTAEGLKKLIKNPAVEKVNYNYPIVPLLSGSVPLINGDEVWDYSINGVFINGTGETVCVIDTGIDYTHPALGGCTNETFLAGTCSKVIGGYDYGNDDNDPVDVHSHGTHVAGIAASENETYKGVAPGAKLVALKVFTDGGAGSSADAISAIDWCVSNASIFNISVITMSIGVTTAGGEEIPYLEYCDVNDSLAAEASWAASQGIFVDASAGNNKGAEGITAPACGENVTSVGSVTKTDGISGYNTAPILKVLAPGSSITSTILDGGFGAKSGTSMAAPHVGGAAALVIQYWKAAYNVTPSAFQVRDKLRWTGKGINDTRNGIVFPRIDVLKAVQPFINFTGESPANDSTTINTFVLVNITSDVNLSTALLEWNYNNGTVRNYTMESKNVSSFYYNLTGLSTGEYNYQAYGNDSVNTWGVSESRTIEVDQTVPVITIYAPENNSYHNSGFNLNVSVTNILLSYANYSINNSSGDLVQSEVNDSVEGASFEWLELVNVSNATFADDNYSLRVFANDSLGNSATGEANFVVDKTVPGLLGFDRSPAIVYNNETVVFYVNVTDTNRNDSGVLISGNWSGSLVNYTMSQESGERFNYSLASGNLSNQERVGYWFYGVDLAGNVNSSAEFNFTVANRNISLVNITNPLNGTVIEVGDWTQFNGTGTDPDEDSLSYAWDFGDGTSSGEQNPLKQFNVTGEFVVVLNISDGYGGDNSTNITVVVNDTTGPSVSSISYDSSVHIESEGNQTVTASVFDYSGIFNVTLYFNETIKKEGSCTDSNTTWSCSWSWNFSTHGNYNFTVEMEDNFSVKQTNSSTYSFSVTSCSDGVKNGDEGGTDCGGSCPDTCPVGDSEEEGGAGGGGGGAGVTLVCSAGAVQCLGTGQYQECLKSGTANKWSETLEVPAGRKCEFGALKEIEAVEEKRKEKEEEEKVEEEKEEAEKEMEPAVEEEERAKEVEERANLVGRAFGFFKGIKEWSLRGKVSLILILVIMALLAAYFVLRRRETD